MTLAVQLLEQIKKHGPMSVGEYMAQCCAAYYAGKSPFGTDGDFITAPEISQIFGELIGAWLADRWGALGKPHAVLCEMGPGRGTLMQDVLRATAHVQGFHEAIRLHMVETSPSLRAVQERALKAMHPRIRWQETLAPLPSLPLLLVANEFFDALPVEQYVGDTLRKVVFGGGRLHFQPAGAITGEASPASTAISAQIGAHIKTHGGAALVIDYGYLEGGVGDTLQAVSKHTHADPLENPGEVDLTAHVDFTALATAAKGAGAQAHGPAEQGAFLKRLGAELRAASLCKAATDKQREAILSGLERLIAPHEMGTLFKVLAITSLKDKPPGF